MLPCYRAAFMALESWVEGGPEAPDSQSVAKPAGGDVVNSCSIDEVVYGPGKRG